ncbi:hypothetical protein OKE68_01265 [Riemerella anatipestifer]|uniref:Uncharacterized protein n=1 Tax=Riemerella anatipestifer TaxID=34085 RepID=A0AAP3AJL0_RIEAN|nr:MULTISPECIES: hypothetical protein [Weeksellaceae]MCW0522950.1 hypothetical protein [Riemerella anatipestifer]MDY3339534.1 hypothetical protein [Riemerella anatipestifer]MDY3352371.1 hypothetical protein [Riemerella anatipestifer]MDY3377005.1 hypothetical protein [Riemerella anatipestifer]MDY3530259.1 hypothetical protein [Riemerella anatipestifer]
MKSRNLIFFIAILSFINGCSSSKEGILRNPINFSKKFTPTIHKVVAPDGTYHWVIGYFLTEEEARGTQVHDAVIPNPRMVFISPTIYKVLP